MILAVLDRRCADRVWSLWPSVGVAGQNIDARFVAIFASAAHFFKQ